MTVGLFVPCYVDQFYPKVAIAALQLLEKQGVQVKTQIAEFRFCLQITKARESGLL